MTVNPSELSRLLVRDAEEQRENGYLHTLSEILQQPQSWIETSAGLAKAFETGSLRATFEPLPDAIVFTGSGSSHYVGECLAAGLQATLNLPVLAIPAGTLLTHRRGTLPPGRGLLVSIARSGDSPESAAVVDKVLAEAPQYRHLVITCNARGRLATRYRADARVAAIVLDERTNDRSLVMYAGINRGNRFVRIGSFASKSRGLHDYIAKKAPQHPNAKVEFKLGDVVTTQIACANGETILLQHDTSLPRPYSLGFRVQGTGGLWMDVNKSIYIDGKSAEEDRWEPAQPWLDKYDHPLWKKYAAQAEGAGHGGMDFFVLHAFVEALKANAPMPIDVYDAVTWSAITPLSEQSIADGNRTLDFPDFTAGEWQKRKPIFAFDDRY